jgi:hypothetical protein
MCRRICTRRFELASDVLLRVVSRAELSIAATGAFFFGVVVVVDDDVVLPFGVFFFFSLRSPNAALSTHRAPPRSRPPFPYRCRLSAKQKNATVNNIFRHIESKQNRTFRNTVPRITNC